MGGMIKLLLALWPIISYPDPQNPNQTLTWVPDPVADIPYMQSDAAMADAAMVRNPGMWQRSSGNIYDRVSEQYPVSEVVPRNQRFTVPMEEQMAMDEYRTQQLGRETAIRGQMLNQRMAQKNFEYENNIISQAEQAMPLYSRVDPRSPTFDAEVADINEKFPLAVQNQGINSMIGRLSSTRNQYVQDQEIKERNLQDHTLRQVARADAMDDEMDIRASQLGAGAYKVYQDELRNNQGDRQAAYSMAATKAAQDEAAFKRQQEVNAPITRADYTAYLRQAQGLLSDPLTKMPRSVADLSPEDRAEYDFLQSQMRSFANQQGGSFQSYRPQVSQSSQSTVTPQSFFPKPSTSKGP